MAYEAVIDAREIAESKMGTFKAAMTLRDARKADADIATTTFGPLDKYVAANDNVPAPRAAAITASLRDKGIYPPERHGDWMQTYSGRQFWPMDPRSDEVHIEDIAHALSLQCRYAGHCIQFYSVAEHSCHVALWLLRNYGPMTAMYGLLHDASEAYLVDVPRPVKPYLTGYKDAETKVQDAVQVRFGLGVGVPKAVKEADDRIIADELVNLRPMEWHKRFDDPLGVKIGCWKPSDAEDEFLSMFVMLDRKMRETGEGGCLTSIEHLRFDRRPNERLARSVQFQPVSKGFKAICLRKRVTRAGSAGPAIHQLLKRVAGAPHCFGGAVTDTDPNRCKPPRIRPRVETLKLHFMRTLIKRAMNSIALILFPSSVQALEIFRPSNMETA